MGFASMMEDMVRRYDEDRFGGYAGPSIGAPSTPIRLGGGRIPRVVEPGTYGPGRIPRARSTPKVAPLAKPTATPRHAGKPKDHPSDSVARLEDITPWLNYCESHLAHMSGRAISALDELQVLASSGEELRIHAESALEDARNFELSIRRSLAADRLEPAEAKGLAERCRKVIHGHRLKARNGLADLKAAVHELSATKHCREALDIISRLIDQLEEEIYRPITPPSKARCEVLLQSAESLVVAVRDIEKKGPGIARELRSTLKQLKCVADAMTQLESRLASFKQRMIRMGGRAALGRGD